MRKVVQGGKRGTGAGRAAQFIVDGLEKRLLLSSSVVKFAGETFFSTGRDPQSLAAVDVNGDGKPDIVAPDYYYSAVAVLLGNGDGTFQNEREFPAGPGAAAVAVGDINGDGKPDIAVGNFGTTTASILLGNGDGTFRLQSSPTTGFGPDAIILQDVNGDGKLDLITANNHAGNVSVLLGNGNGTFQTQRTFAAGSMPTSVVAADFNGDGKIDLAVGNAGTTSMSVLLGNGDGTFQNFQALGAAADHLITTDVNDDGKADLAFVNNSSVGTLLGNGNGTFRPGQMIPTAGPSGGVAVADFNGDGKLDLGITNYNQHSIGVLIGNGNGTFLSPQLFPTVTNPGPIAAVDLDGDGSPDLAFLHPYANQVGLMINQTNLVLPRVLSINRTTPAGPKTNSSSVTFTITFNKPVTGVDLGDFSVDNTGVAFNSTTLTPANGSVYTFTISGISGTGTVGLNLIDNGTIRDLAGRPLSGGAAAFSAPQQAGYAYFNSFAVADLNGDGKPDLVATAYYSSGQFSMADSYVVVMLGNGNGTFQHQSVRTFAANSDPTQLAVADLNGDGRPDLAVFYASFDSVGLLIGNGDGTFQPGHTIAAGPNANSMASADLNGDGNSDIVLATNDGTVDVLLGNGNGTLQPERTLAAGAGPTSPVVADLNGDGIPDLAIANSGLNAYGVSALLGNGNGTFRPLQSSGPAFISRMTAADLNGDGKIDLVGVYGGVNVTVLLGNGNGTFQPQQTYYGGIAVRDVAVADLNGDGIPDVAVTDASGASIAVLLGNGDGTLRPRQTVAVHAGPSGIAAADFNGDGLADLAEFSGLSLNVLLDQPNGSFSGQVYTIVPIIDTVTGSSGNDTITLKRDPDNMDIDWMLSPSTGLPTSGLLPINDPNGLTINGNGGNDSINLDYTNGDPLPSTMHLNGTFTINNLEGTDPLAGTTLEIGRSTVFISYSSDDPIAAIQRYLKNGYNSGAWNGAATASAGVIRSLPAQTNPNHSTAIGYADFADAHGVNTTMNTIELTYTLYGDANLDHQVNSADLQILLFNLNRPGSWDQGDFNYDDQVNSADLQLLLFMLNTSLGSQVASATTAAYAPAVTSQHKRGAVPTIQVTPVPVTRTSLPNSRIGRKKHRE